MKEIMTVPFWRGCMALLLMLGFITVLLDSRTANLASATLQEASSLHNQVEHYKNASIFYAPAGKDNNDSSWILNLRVQKTGSTTSEVFLQSWLQQHGMQCDLLRSCKTVHHDDSNNTWKWDKNTPACTCDKVDEIIQENVRNATTCRAINGPHMDYKDLTQWFHGDCSTSTILLPSVTIVTVLRHPVDRVISEYNMLSQHARQTGEPYFIKGWDYGCQAKSLQEYLSNNDCQLGSSNRQTRMIAGHGSNRRWQYVYDSPQEMLQTAKDNLLYRVDFGITEHWQESARLLDQVLTKTLGKSVSNSMQKRQKPVWERKSGKRLALLRLPNATRELAEQINSLDQELYDFAVDLFWKRYCNAFPHEQQCQIN